MTSPLDPITETDLHAYIDDQLQVQRRIEVEAHLSRHPEMAARLMSDLRARDELRLALADQGGFAGRTPTYEAALRLSRGLSRDELFGRLRRIAAVIGFVAIGWLAHGEYGSLGIRASIASAPPPAFVDDAARAHRTALVRASMHSQPADTNYDPEEIRSATAIVLPKLPAGWQVSDVQIFPSTYGPSVEMAIRTDKLGTLSLFAVRPGGFNVRPTTVAAENEVTAIYWQLGEVAYALVGKAESRALETAANDLVKTLY
jgi:anti-sigma factor RsiW